MLKPEDLLPDSRVYEILNSHGVSVSNSVVTAGAVHQILAEAAEKFEEAVQQRLEALLPGMTPRTFRYSVEVNPSLWDLRQGGREFFHKLQRENASRALAGMLMDVLPLAKIKPPRKGGLDWMGAEHRPVGETWVWEGVIFTAKPEVENVPQENP